MLIDLCSKRSLQKDKTSGGIPATKPNYAGGVGLPTVDRRLPEPRVWDGGDGSRARDRRLELYWWQFCTAGSNGHSGRDPRDGVVSARSQGQISTISRHLDIRPTSTTSHPSCTYGTETDDPQRQRRRIADSICSHAASGHRLPNALWAATKAPRGKRLLSRTKEHWRASSPMQTQGYVNRLSVVARSCCGPAWVLLKRSLSLVDSFVAP